MQMSPVQRIKFPPSEDRVEKAIRNRYLPLGKKNAPISVADRGTVFQTPLAIAE